MKLILKIIWKRWIIKRQHNATTLFQKLRFKKLSYARNDTQIGIVGAGLIGLSWAGLFSAFGYQTIVYDPLLKQKDLANKP